MSRKTSRENARQVELTGRLGEFREALQDEIAEIEKSGQSSILLSDGKKLIRGGSGFWYQFRVTYVPTIPADTPCKLVIGDSDYDVTVVSFDDTFIIVSSNESLPDTLAKARLENGSTVLMERLIRCIEDNHDKENQLGNCMFVDAGLAYRAKAIQSYNDLDFDESDNEEQRKAISTALTYDISYIWGPPGTGKTTVIGKLINELYKHNRSVLLVSHTNTAVDEAIKSADKAICENYTEEDPASPYPILRLGNPVKQLPERILLKSHVDKAGAELFTQIETLKSQKSKKENEISEASMVLAKFAWIKDSHIRSLTDLVHSLDKYDEEIRLSKFEIERLTAEKSEMCAAHPEYATYNTMLADYSSFCLELDALLSERKKRAKTILDLEKQIEIDQDEIKKHSLSAELREKAGRYMSLSFLKGEMNKAETVIISLVNETKKLMSEKLQQKQIVNTYENKNALSKLLSSKKAVEKALASQLAIDKRLQEIKTERNRLFDLISAYTQQCKEIEILNAQIAALVPSKTAEYWKDELARLKTEVDNTNDALAIIDKKIEILRAKTGEIEARIKAGKAVFNSINILVERLQQLEQRIVGLSNSRQQNYTSCLRYLEHEKSLVRAFANSINADELAPGYSELCDLYTKVKAETDTYNYDEIYRTKEDAESNLASIIQQIDELQFKLQELEKQVIEQAKVIGVTLAKSYLSDPLRQRKFDTVILDEASMAPIPALWCASYLADNSLVIVGDFLQLPPICLSKTPLAKEWLGKDIFYHSGIQMKAREHKDGINNFVMLNKQYRMEPKIAAVANMYYGEYGGLSSPVTDKRIKDRKKFYDWYGGKQTINNIHLMDTESLHAWVTGVPQGKGHSRMNAISASIDVEIAFKTLENKLAEIDAKSYNNDNDLETEASVLIVAPYKPQIAYINQLIDLKYKDRGFKVRPNFIKAGTVHSFQGAEADVVIFDLVVDEPHWKANLFINDEDANETNQKMFNVAITRAKFKLFIVGNFSYCQKHAKRNALARLLNYLINERGFKKVDAKKAFPDIVFAQRTAFSSDQVPRGKMLYCIGESFDEYFKQDLSSFKENAIIFSPFMTQNRMAELLPFFVDAVNSGKIIVIVTKSLSERGKSEKSRYRQCEGELEAIGVKVVHKKGMHEKVIVFDNEVYWSGSLNPLSFSGATGEQMLRIEDSNAVSVAKKLYFTEHIMEAVEQHEQCCPICGNELVVRDSADGGIYWECAECGYKRNRNQQYPQDGVLKCKCGASYSFAMRTEPRWVCTQNPRHYTRIRKNDLRLEKMVELIPIDMREEVKQYFEHNHSMNNTVSDDSENGRNMETPEEESYGQQDMFSVLQ